MAAYRLLTLKRFAPLMPFDMNALFDICCIRVDGDDMKVLMKMK